MQDHDADADRRRKREETMRGWNAAMWIFGSVCVLALLLAAAVALFGPPRDSEAEIVVPPSEADRAREQEAAETQAERLAAMERMQRDRLLVSHETTDSATVRAVMSPAFFDLDDREKGAILGVVWWYYRDGRGIREPVDVRVDNGSAIGGRRGSYDPLDGYAPAN